MPGLLLLLEQPCLLLLNVGGCRVFDQGDIRNGSQRGLQRLVGNTARDIADRSRCLFDGASRFLRPERDVLACCQCGAQFGSDYSRRIDNPDFAFHLEVLQVEDSGGNQRDQRNHRRHEEQMILNRVRDGKSVEHYETVRMRKDGTMLDISLTVSPMRNDEGQIVGASKIARELDARRRDGLDDMPHGLRRACALHEEYLVMSLDAIHPLDSGK